MQEELYINGLIEHFSIPGNKKGLVITPKENAKDLDVEKLKSIAKNKGYIFTDLSEIDSIKLDKKSKLQNHVLYKAS